MRPACGSSRFEGQAARHAQLDLGSESELAHDAEVRANSVGPLAHSLHAPAPATPVDLLVIDAAAVVADRNAELGRAVLDGGVDVLGARVPVGVDDGLAPDAIDVLA